MTRQVPAGTPSLSVTAGCPPNKVVVGGGFDAVGLQVDSSKPTSPPQQAWVVEVTHAPGGGRVLTVTVFAMCISGG